jgi:hypothetical protein
MGERKKQRENCKDKQGEKKEDEERKPEGLSSRIKFGQVEAF